MEEKARTTKEDVDEASGRGDREDWFEGKCPETRKVKRRNANNCRRNGVNPAISAKGTTLDKNQVTTTSKKLYPPLALMSMTTCVGIESTSLEQRFCTSLS